MFQEISEFRLAQADGGLPTLVAAGSAPGESGVFVSRVRFHAGSHVSATPRLHGVFFHLAPYAHVDCRMGDRALSHKPSRGSLAICPAGVDFAADGQGSAESIVVAIEPGQFSLAAAEGSAFKAELIERFDGRDRTLFDLARSLAAECADGYPNGPLFWNDMASTFIDGLLVRHTSKFKGPARGWLDEEVLGHLRDYISLPISMSRSMLLRWLRLPGAAYFTSRVCLLDRSAWPRTANVVHLRLQRALELMRDGRHSQAEIAAATGFADQSHLSRWVRRVRGVSLTEFMAR